jgi:hypothetical protein
MQYGFRVWHSNIIEKQASQDQFLHCHLISNIQQHTDRPSTDVVPVLWLCFSPAQGPGRHQLFHRLPSSLANAVPQPCVVAVAIRMRLHIPPQPSHELIPNCPTIQLPGLTLLLD